MGEAILKGLGTECCRDLTWSCSMQLWIKSPLAVWNSVATVVLMKRKASA
jgi:hypothetical protein